MQRQFDGKLVKWSRGRQLGKRWGLVSRSETPTSPTPTPFDTPLPTQLPPSNPNNHPGPNSLDHGTLVVCRGGSYVRTPLSSSFYKKFKIVLQF